MVVALFSIRFSSIFFIQKESGVRKLILNTYVFERNQPRVSGKETTHPPLAHSTHTSIFTTMLPPKLRHNY